MIPNLTKQQAVYQHLREQILEGKLVPGQRLIIDTIARDFGLSIIPVREAIQLLQAERLVDVQPHVGATVTPLTRESIEEVFIILEGMEAMAVRRVAAKMPPGLDERLQRLIRQMDAAEKRNDVEKWSALNMEFHLAISDATRMPWLREITERTLVNWSRIRRYFFREGASHRFTEAQREHHAIVKALRQEKTDVAETLIRRHNQRAFRHYSRLPHARPGK